MKISTVSIVAGTYSCNAKCPFCIASQTPHIDYDNMINEHDLRIGCRLGSKSGATTCLITGKGEPTLYPEEVSSLISIAQDYFPLLELQTNGMRFKWLEKEGYLDMWYKDGLRTICLSTTHWEQIMNQKIYGKPYLDIDEIHNILAKHDLRLRLSVMMYKGGIDNVDKAKAMVDYCRKLEAKPNSKRKIQLTMRPVVCWDNDQKDAQGKKAIQWTTDHLVDTVELKKFYQWATSYPTILTIPPNGKIVDILGQNLCITDCLTTNDSTEEMRQIILYPNGGISYDWKYEAAFLM